MEQQPPTNQKNIQTHVLSTMMVKGYIVVAVKMTDEDWISDLFLICSNTQTKDPEAISEVIRHTSVLSVCASNLLCNSGLRDAYLIAMSRLQFFTRGLNYDLILQSAKKDIEERLDKQQLATSAPKNEHAESLIARFLNDMQTRIRQRRQQADAPEDDPSNPKPIA